MITVWTRPASVFKAVNAVQSPAHKKKSPVGCWLYVLSTLSLSQLNKLTLEAAHKPCYIPLDFRAFVRKYRRERRETSYIYREREIVVSN